MTETLSPTTDSAVDSVADAWPAGAPIPTKRIPRKAIPLAWARIYGKVTLRSDGSLARSYALNMPKTRRKGVKKSQYSDGIWCPCHDYNCPDTAYYPLRWVEGDYFGFTASEPAFRAAVSGCLCELLRDFESKSTRVLGAMHQELALAGGVGELAANRSLTAYLEVRIHRAKPDARSAVQVVLSDEPDHWLRTWSYGFKRDRDTALPYVEHNQYDERNRAEPWRSTLATLITDFDGPMSDFVRDGTFALVTAQARGEQASVAEAEAA